MMVIAPLLIIINLAIREERRDLEVRIRAAHLPVTIDINQDIERNLETEVDHAL